VQQAAAAATAGKHRPQGSGGRSAASSLGPQQQQQIDSVAGGAGGVGINPLDQPAALLPAVVTDHTSGLAVLRTWSSESPIRQG
jgi:hypothetical protein